MKWTIHKDAELIALAREGLDRYQIAEKFNVTPNAVSGRSHKLGLKIKRTKRTKRCKNCGGFMGCAGGISCPGAF